MMWYDKPFYSLNYYLTKKFGQKVFKIALNAGFSCPNRDGTIDSRGCIFCSAGGSGEFASSSNQSITQQIESGKQLLSKKFKGNKYIAYFQAYTNTYASYAKLRETYFEALNNPSIVGLSIATRPDCLDENIIKLLDEINQIKPVWIELGLQTIHERTAKFIRRGYNINCFEHAVKMLNEYNLNIVVHLILGLPYETYDDMIATINYISHCKIQGVKLQLLHVLKGTDLALLYKQNSFSLLSREDYIKLVVDCIERLPSNIVIHRITGDGPRNILIAPRWSTDKKALLNDILKEFKIRNTYQGKLYFD